MENKEHLYKSLGLQAYQLGLMKPAIPEFVQNNLKYSLFDWQREALENLITFNNIRERKSETGPVHLMFNMATGTGKTLLMASCILYYYKLGYRKFIFLVNQKNIIFKTENNFIDTNSNKYLFNDKIVIDDKIIPIKKVETFSNNNEGIEIKLTTIQQLYNDIHIAKENQVILSDLIKKDIVFLADEAHHLNTDTKKIESELDLDIEIKDNTSVADVEKKGWEHTVIELLLNKNGNVENNKNVLLEFTATIPELPKVIDKYISKTIAKFGLKEFLNAGYTKEINLLSSSLEKKERILQSLLFNWYRHKIALKHNLSNWKPVILFRSKTIEDSKTDFEEFLNLVNNLKVEDFEFLKEIESKFSEGSAAFEQGKNRVLGLINFIQKENIHLEEIIAYIKDNFTKRNCIITNSKTNKGGKEKIDQDIEKSLNNLEDKENHIRAVFTVFRLTEGWDVLNLFDIVRLYTGRDEGKNGKGLRKAGTSTVSEIQLIGRGVRYYPFKYKDTIPNKRKFDEDTANELRTLEELYYHSDSDHKYIDELKRELKNKGLINDERVEKRFNLKPEFKNSVFFKQVKIWKNEKLDNPNRQKTTVKDLFNEPFKYDIESFSIKEEQIDLNDEFKDTERLNYSENNKGVCGVLVRNLDNHLFFKAIHIKAKAENSLYRFNRLKQDFKIASIEDFKNNIIGDVEIKFYSTFKDFEDIPKSKVLKVLIKFLDDIQIKLKANINPFVGSEFKPVKLSECFGREIRKNVKENTKNNEKENDLKHEPWYVVDQFYGTSEEKSLIDFIHTTINNLKEKYPEVYLIRNEEQFKIYDFNTGRGFQPDFLLCLRDENNLYYQVLIEPKGDHLLLHDEWKNNFLKQISAKYGYNKILKAENRNYRLIGLPLYNESNDKSFEEEYNKIIKF